MKTSYLFPYQFRKIGWLIFLPAGALGLLSLIFDWEFEFFNAPVFALFSEGVFEDATFFKVIENNIFDEIAGVLVIIGLLLIAFSKERQEDEFIARIRLESLVWATYINYAILILALLLVYDISFFWVMIFNMFTILVFFIISFNWAIYNMKRSIEYEK